MKPVPPDPELSDGIVMLRPWTARDAPEVAVCCREDEIARWLDQVPQPYTEGDAREYVAATRRGWKDGSAASFAITDVETGEVLGSIGLHWIDPGQHIGEVGYWVRREARGRGVATRALRLASAWAIETCGLERLQLRADVLNAVSQRVAETSGFTREGVLRSSRYNPRQGRRVDFVVYSLLPGELTSHQGQSQ